MTFEEQIFFRYEPNKKKLINYGFIEEDNKLIKSFKLNDDEFEARLMIYNSKVEGKVIDLNFNEEFSLFRSTSAQGSFVNQIREQYLNLLLEIRECCFEELIFPDKQSIRISDHIKKTYGSNPEFLWKKYPTYGIFRNQRNNKWYACILDVGDDKLGKGISGRSIINLKANEALYNEFLKVKNIFPGWHMNKKKWVSVSLSDYFPDEFIESMIDMSYEEIDSFKSYKRNYRN